MRRGVPTTRSPEEIRHLSITRSLRGYDRAEVDRLLAEIADSFEAVWHERTRLYEEVRREQAVGAQLRDEAERARADRDARVAELSRAQANIRELQAAMEELEPAYGQEELRKERDKLLDEVRRMGAATVEERRMRQKLVDFLLDGLKRVERAQANGSTADLGEPQGRQNGALDEGQPSFGSAADDEHTSLPS